MKKILHTASEIAEKKIPGLPGTRDGVRMKAEREGWYYEERTGLGGKHKVYEIPPRYLGGTGSPSVSQASAFTPDNVLMLNAARQARLLEIGRAVDQWLLESNQVMNLDKKYLLIELLAKYFELDKQVDNDKLTSMLGKLA